MPAPRAPGAVFLSKNQMRQMENRNNAQQEARYATPAFQRLYTVDTVVPTSTASLVVSDTDTPKWRYTKLKGLAHGSNFDVANAGYASTGVAARSLVCAICEYELDGRFLRMREMARSAPAPVGTSLYVFPTVLTPDYRKNYAVATHILFAGGPATSSFQSADETAPVITKEDATAASASFDWDLSLGSVGGLDIVSAAHPIAFTFYTRGNNPDYVVRIWY